MIGKKYDFYVKEESQNDERESLNNSRSSKAAPITDPTPKCKSTIANYFR